MTAFSDADLVARMAEDPYKGAHGAVEAQTLLLLDPGWSAERILNDALVAGMRDVAVDFETGALLVPEAVRAANAMFGGMEILRPMLRQSDRRPVARAVMTVLQGNARAPGRNLIAITLVGRDVEAAGPVLRGLNREIRLAG